jgi:hypothetical protein
MRIRYLSDGMTDIVEVEVLAAGDHHFFVSGASCHVLRAIPKELVVSEFHANSDDYPPSIFELLLEEDNEINDIDFRLADIFKVSH